MVGCCTCSRHAGVLSGCGCVLGVGDDCDLFEFCVCGTVLQSCCPLGLCVTISKVPSYSPERQCCLDCMCCSAAPQVCWACFQAGMLRCFVLVCREKCCSCVLTMNSWFGLATAVFGAPACCACFNHTMHAHMMLLASR
jgi:hypothetical protein